jgi:hypothetical protein
MVYGVSYLWRPALTLRELPNLPAMQRTVSGWSTTQTLPQQSGTRNRERAMKVLHPIYERMVSHSHGCCRAERQWNVQPNLKQHHELHPRTREQRLKPTKSH